MTPKSEPAVDSALAHGERGMSRIYVWDGVVRLTHWGLALSLVVLSVTGIYLGSPFLVAPAEGGFVTGTARAMHFYAGIVFGVSLMARLVWMITGSYFARWHQFVPLNALRRRQFVDTLKFYLYLNRELPPNVIGHNPVAGAAYLGIYMLELFMVLSGLALYGMFATQGPFGGFAALLPWMGGAQVARTLHHIVMWVLIAFFVQHFYSGMLASVLEKNGTLESIFSGWKWFRTPKGGDE